MKYLLIIPLMPEVVHSSHLYGTGSWICVFHLSFQFLHGLFSYPVRVCIVNPAIPSHCQPILSDLHGIHITHTLFQFKFVMANTIGDT